MKSNEADYKIASDGYLSDTQVAMLLSEKLATQPTIDFYDSSFITPMNKGSVASDAKKAILIGQGVDTQNIGRIVASTYESLTRNLPQNAKDFSLVVPVCIRRDAAPENTQNPTGSHWVLVVLKPENLNEASGKISYKMTFADSMRNSDGQAKSPTGTEIFDNLKSAGVDVGSDFADKSVYQQSRESWSCGYRVAENAIDILDNQRLRSHDANALKRDAQVIFDLALAAEIQANVPGNTADPVRPARQLQQQTPPPQPKAIKKEPQQKPLPKGLPEEYAQWHKNLSESVNDARSQEKRRNIQNIDRFVKPAGEDIKKIEQAQVKPGMDVSLALAIRLQQEELNKAKRAERQIKSDEAFARKLQQQELNGPSGGSPTRSR